MNLIKPQYSYSYLILVFIFIFFFGIHTEAQQIMDIQTRYNHAKDLYQKRAFKAAISAFSKSLELPYLAESNYFLASSAIRSGHSDGEKLMRAFVKNYPYHVYVQSAYLDIANYYFDRERYKKALENYNKSGAYLTSVLLFRKGYCEFNLDQNDKALATFKKLDGSFSPYQNDAAYFRGYIHHSKGDYETSYTFLAEAFESEKYGKPAMGLYASTLYQKGKYQELINLIEAGMMPVDNGAVLNFLAASQYSLGKYGSAASNYKELLDSYPKHRNEGNYFRAGFSSFKIENRNDAIEYLKISAVADDSVGAYASYYLGVIYSEKKNLPFAITSFGNTAKYSTVLKEDALYHQVKFMMEVPNYQGAIEVLNVYNMEYKNGKFNAQANEMLSTAYAQTNNYDLAIKYIEALERLTPQIKQTYQRVSFLKGVSFFNDKRFSLATEVFQKSLIYDEDPSITQQAYYWIGEALSFLDNQDEALFYYKSIGRSPSAEVYLKAVYGKAYGYYNLKDYASAAALFGQFESEYSSGVHKKYLADALLRMGDCQFALKQYQLGIDYYGKADEAGNKNKDHIYFQIGLLNRYLDNDAQAKKYFTKLIDEIPESTRADHAYFQMAQIDFEKANSKKAIEAYGRFMIKYPTSSFVPFALLNQAIAYDNEGQFELSVSNYKEILNRFPRHQTANSALLGLQDKNANRQFEGFDKYLQKYKQANPDSEALENIEFETAKANYYNQKYELAIKGFESFNRAYPKSSLILGSLYFIGEAYYRRDQLSKSLDYFLKLKDFRDFYKYPKVLYRIASIQNLRGDLSQSNDFYHQLSKVSLSSRDVINVNNGLMENHFASGIYDSAIYYGNALLDNPQAGVLVSANANLIIGKSEHALNNFDEALQNLLPLSHQVRY